MGCGELLPIIDVISVYTSSKGTCFRADLVWSSLGEKVWFHNESANFNLLGKLSEIRYLFFPLV